MPKPKKPTRAKNTSRVDPAAEAIAAPAPEDRTTAYARAVVAGEVPAGPHVRDSARRHLDDLKNGVTRGIYFDLAAARRAIGFFADVLRVERTAADGKAGPGEDDETKPFVLLDWQAFIVGCLFGWKGDDGFRRFRVAFIEAPKGAGKSPLAAGIGLYMEVADNEFRAEVYVAAFKKDQARVLFRDAAAMVQTSPPLAERMLVTGGNEPQNIAYLATGSFFRPISSEQRGKGQSGPRPHCALLDEVHEHPSNAMVEFMRAGTKGRKQALIVLITNSGSDKNTVCGQHHDYASKVAGRLLEDDSYFSYVCGLDDGDDPLHDETVWAKANPSLGTVITRKYLAEQVREARGMPSKRNLILRLNFCVWTESESVWIDKDAWMSCEHRMDLSDYHGRKVTLGCDLSKKKDLTALSLCFENEDGTIDVFVESWTPKDTMKEREEIDHAPYALWVAEGFLAAVPGKVIDYAWLAKRVNELDRLFEIEKLAFDRWRIDDLLVEFDELGIQYFRREKEPNGSGIELIPIGQGFKDMGPVVEAIEGAILDGSLRAQENPLLRWNVASAVTDEDATGARKFDKRKATGKIDGLVSMAMGVRTVKQFSKGPPKVYQMLVLGGA